MKAVSLRDVMMVLEQDLPEYADLEVLGLCDDSRTLRQGDIFLAVPGENTDGRNYIDHAIENGALAVLVEKNLRWNETTNYRQVPIIAIENLSTKMAALCADFYDNPSHHLAVIGITGTNAKTSCSSYIQQLLYLLHSQCGLIGTLGWGIADHLVSTGNTTPGNVLLQQILHGFVMQKIPYVALEVSSHGLQLGRVKNIKFKAALFTNLSQDHLDFHGDMQNYAAAKKQLFSHEHLDLAVINSDDEYAQQFIDVVPAHTRILSYGFSEQAQLRIHNFESSLHAMHAQLSYEGRSYTLHASLLGDFNIYNVTATIAVLMGLGYQIETVLQHIPKVKPVSGRMERMEDSQKLGFTTLIDYAHTPDGLEKVLSTLDKHKHDKNIWCVFGCGGNRDQSKRALMGAVAKRYASKIILTSDNPRDESPQKIIDDIAVACYGENVEQEIDREKAIYKAILGANTGDCVLIAGKGHENYQEIDNKKYPFSDHLIVKQALEHRARCIS